MHGPLEEIGRHFAPIRPLLRLRAGIAHHDDRAGAVAVAR
jgi:hypothetical protein